MYAFYIRLGGLTLKIELLTNILTSIYVGVLKCFSCRDLVNQNIKLNIFKNVD